jgi:hypothetical protein
LLALLSNLSCNNYVELRCTLNYLWNGCNMWLVMLNHYELGWMLVGLKSLVISMDYRSYMGSSARIWSLQWLFFYLCSYNLDGSVIDSTSPAVAAVPPTNSSGTVGGAGFGAHRKPLCAVVHERPRGIRTWGRVAETKTYSTPALVDSASEHGPLPSSRDATRRLSSSRANVLFFVRRAFWRQGDLLNHAPHRWHCLGQLTCLGK